MFLGLDTPPPFRPSWVRLFGGGIKPGASIQQAAYVELLRLTDRPFWQPKRSFSAHKARPTRGKVNKRCHMVSTFPNVTGRPKGIHGNPDGLALSLNTQTISQELFAEVANEPPPASLPTPHCPKHG